MGYLPTCGPLVGPDGQGPCLCSPEPVNCGCRCLDTSRLQTRCLRSSRATLQMITHADEPAQGDQEIRPLLGERLGLALSDDEFGFLLLQGTLAEIASVSDDKRRQEAALRKAVETIRNLRAAQGMPVG